MISEDWVIDIYAKTKSIPCIIGLFNSTEGNYYEIMEQLVGEWIEKQKI